MKRNLTYMILFLSIVFASGGYDHGSSTGKGKFQIDLTWNPFNKINYGQMDCLEDFKKTTNKGG